MPNPLKSKHNCPKTPIPSCKGKTSLTEFTTSKYSIQANTFGVAGIDPNNGAALIQWDFVNAANHKFELKNIGENIFTLKAMHSNRYLNVAGQSRTTMPPSPNGITSIRQTCIFRSSPMAMVLTSAANNPQKYWHLYGGNEQAANGIAVVQYAGGGAIFALELAESGFKVNKDQLEKVGSAITRL